MIDPIWMLALAGALLSGVLSVLIALLAWMGNKLYQKVEDIAATMHKIAGDLHGKISDLDRRITRIETRCDDMSVCRGGDEQ